MDELSHGGMGDVVIDVVGCLDIPRYVPLCKVEGGTEDTGGTE